MPFVLERKMIPTSAFYVCTDRSRSRIGEHRWTDHAKSAKPFTSRADAEERKRSIGFGADVAVSPQAEGLEP